MLHSTLKCTFLSERLCDYPAGGIRQPEVGITQPLGDKFALLSTNWGKPIKTGSSRTFRTKWLFTSANRSLPWTHHATSYPMCQFSRAFAMAISLTLGRGERRASEFSRVELLSFTMKSNFRRPPILLRLPTLFLSFFPPHL